MSPDRWWALTVRPADGDTEPEPASDIGEAAAVPRAVDGEADAVPPEVGGLVADVLVSLGGRAVEEGEGAWTTHFLPPPDPDALLRELSDRLRDRTGVRWSIEHHWQPHEEWADLWRRGLDVRRIGRRIVVRPSWTPPPEVAPDDVVIELDPGVAFGTAEHGTTRGCLRLLEAVVGEGDRVVDVGAGSGILSLAAAGLGARRVVALDSDPVAVEAARENVNRNGASDRIRVEVREVTPAGLADGEPFDGAVANLETPLLLPLLAALASSVKRGGWVVLGGILEEEAARVEAALGEAGLTVESGDVDEGWWSVLARRDAAG